MGCLPSLVAIEANPFVDSPVFIAAARGDMEQLAVAVLEADMATTETVQGLLVQYATTGDLEALERLPVPVSDAIEQSLGCGLSPLEVAIVNSHVECARALLSLFAVRAVGNKARMLMLGAAAGNTAMLELLVGPGGSLVGTRLRQLRPSAVTLALRSPNPASAAVLCRLLDMHQDKLRGRAKRIAIRAGVYKQLKQAHLRDLNRLRVLGWV